MDDQSRHLPTGAVLETEAKDGLRQKRQSAAGLGQWLAIGPLLTTIPSFKGENEPFLQGETRDVYPSLCIIRNMVRFHRVKVPRTPVFTKTTKGKTAIMKLDTQSNCCLPQLGIY
jgi:hypothetical protein